MEAQVKPGWRVPSQTVADSTAHPAGSGGLPEAPALAQEALLVMALEKGQTFEAPLADILFVLW